MHKNTNNVHIDTPIHRSFPASPSPKKKEGNQLFTSSKNKVTEKVRGKSTNYLKRHTIGNAAVYNKATKPTTTAASAPVTPESSRPTATAPFVPVGAAVLVLVAVGLWFLPASVGLLVAEGVKTWLIVGRATSPFRSQPPAVDFGQAGAVSFGVYAALAVPLGLLVFQTAWRLEKSG